eukprot:6211081-Pleurochrysis_carterae.AAC.4
MPARCRATMCSIRKVRLRGAHLDDTTFGPVPALAFLVTQKWACPLCLNFTHSSSRVHRGQNCRSAHLNCAYSSSPLKLVPGILGFRLLRRAQLHLNLRCGTPNGGKKRTAY